MSELSIAEIGGRICDALGLDSSKVTSVTLKFEAGSLPVAHIERLVIDEAAVNGVAVHLEGFELHPIEEPKKSSAPDTAVFLGSTTRMSTRRQAG